MSEEQTIYIGPEDDLTSVRERLESIQSRRVTLVIPAQTQLRSHVAWKLLHARARELSKDVLIVSSDPQIRSVAQAVKFKVAHSLESSPIIRSRPTTSRTGRSSAAGRGKTSKQRDPEARGPRSASRSGSSASASPARPQSQPLPAKSAKPSGQLPPKNTVKNVESQPVQEDEATTGKLQEPFSPPIFDISEKEAPYEYSRNEAPQPPPVTPMPAIHPLSPEQIDEEPDLLFEDFQLAQDIRRAASNETANKATPQVEPLKEAPPRAEPRPPHRSVLLPHPVDDPFASMEDDSKPPVRAEQRGGVSLEGSDTTEQQAVQDIAEMPTGILDHDIEDMGDQGAFEIFSDAPPITHHDWEDEIHTSKPVQKPEPEREPSTRGSRSGNLKKTPRPTRPDLGNEDALPPVQERPTRVIPTTSKPLSPAASRPLSRSGGLAQPARPAASASNRPGAPVAPASNRPGTPARSRPGLSRPQQRPKDKPARQPAPQRSRAGRAAATQQRNIAAYISIFVIILILLFVGALAYFIPSAQVTVTLPSHTYTHDIALKVVSAGQLAKDQQATGTMIGGDELTRTFTKSGTGTATGTEKINNQTAIGSVFFTNNGTSLVTVPTGTIVATAGANGQKFVTTANAVVPPPGSNVGNTTEVPIEAQSPGPAGNVKSGTITVIPDDSQSQIAKASDSNMTPANLKLLVSNAAATTGGGAGNATVVSQKDLDAVKKTLQDALQSDIDAWVKQQKVGQGDIVGTRKIDATLSKAPAAKTPAKSGTFPAELSATVTLMIVRHTALQNATIQQLNTLLAKDQNYKGYIVSHDARQPLQIQQLKQSGEGTALTLNFKAQAQTIPNLTIQQVQTLVAGKQIPDATRLLKGLKDVQDVSIQTSPGFVSWVTTWTPNIHIVFVPGTAPKK
ncbi:hypothetical protein KSF_026500 [Reticulibacter mediterranei]|uniref:Baseplate protein J-like barrel domain-containing protein n=1 Tax=Reticulibacter mediterranei TaxID=2778369 RepID=A0A8J3N063_9CHLR|nr:baseplate J/gp47 family protein [Reticulibacter mediterranei]GHO92602.1 hypothetical protein KSF_026500 [Reticulibacter mediterranei]